MKKKMKMRLTLIQHYMEKPFVKVYIMHLNAHALCWRTKNLD